MVWMEITDKHSRLTRSKLADAWQSLQDGSPVAGPKPRQAQARCSSIRLIR